MQKTILIALAGLAGTLLRYWLAGYVTRQYGETFPWGTMIVNLIGCLVTGAVFYVTEERFLLNPTVRTVILIGLLGGFTTFSSYGLQTFTLLRDGEYILATLNVVTSNVLGLFMVWAGYAALGKVF
jgi:CrcB protein